jgi:hypothetical protein
MTVHTKWEMLVQKLLKSVELFKSYGFFGELKVVDFLFFPTKISIQKNSSIFFQIVYDQKLDFFNKI